MLFADIYIQVHMCEVMTNKKNCCAEKQKICLRSFRRKMSPPILPNTHNGRNSVQTN